MTLALRTHVHAPQPRPAMVAPPRVSSPASPVVQAPHSDEADPGHAQLLVEVVFEGCSEASALRIVARLCASARTVGAFEVRGVQRPGVALEDVLAMLQPAWPWAHAMLDALCLDALCVAHGRLSLFRDRGTCDASLVFSVPSDAEDDVAAALRTWARHVVAGEELDVYYAGREPAVDEEGCFFTNTPGGDSARWSAREPHDVTPVRRPWRAGT